jgi:hypothetical protein
LNGPGVSSTTFGSDDAERGATAEQLGEEPHHRLAVLQHVRDAGRRAGIVFQHVERVRIDTHDVDAGDMDIDTANRLHRRHHRLKGRVLQNEVLRHEAGTHDLALSIGIADEGVQRLDALLQALCKLVPLRRGEDPRHDVERDDPLRALGVAIDVEGDSDAPEEVFRL